MYFSTVHNSPKIEIPNLVFFSGDGGHFASIVGSTLGAEKAKRRSGTFGGSVGSRRRPFGEEKQVKFYFFSNLYSSRTRRLYTRETHAWAFGRPPMPTVGVSSTSSDGWTRRETRARDVGSGDGRTTKRRRNERTTCSFGGTQSAWSASSVGTRSSDFNFIPIHSSVSFRSKRGAFWGWCLSICLVE